ncbi:AFG1-like ATPase-domain-containing protein [Cladochytrium replicatum]|nr:AFG1-like ATPase-domain-containing protein [Cladochytrium replicatum]
MVPANLPFRALRAAAGAAERHASLRYLRRSVYDHTRTLPSRRPFSNRPTVGFQSQTMTSTTSSLTTIGPLAEYRRRVALELLKPDESQHRAIVKLQQLCEDLLDYRPPSVVNPSHEIPSLPLERTGATGGGFSAAASMITSLIPVITDDEPVFIGPRGLWIWGGVGTGKTLMLDLFFDSIPVAQKRRVHFHAFMLSVYARINAFNTLREEGDPKINSHHVLKLVAQDIVRESWLLCFDEFQVTDIATATILKQLFEHMFSLGAVLVVTSNRVPEDLYKGGLGGYQRHLYGPFIDILNDRCELYRVTGSTDYRSVMADESPVNTQETYYLLDDDDQVAAFIKRVGQLFYGKDVRRKILTVYGREIVVPKQADGIALFTFEELCGSKSTMPLGAADYLSIAQQYTTIVVQSIPRMGLPQKNEARRFINFVDACYENKVKVICSADAPADDLFVVTDDPASFEDSETFMHREMLGDLMGMTGRGRRASRSDINRLAIFTAEDERFAFRRAVSRLHEMRSSVYLASNHAPKPVDIEFDVADTVRELGQVDNGGRSVSRTNPATEERLGSEAYGDDFGDEASYRGYLEMYKRFNDGAKQPPKYGDTVQRASKDPESYPIRRDVWERSQTEKPRPLTNQGHFWGLGLWGRKKDKEN